MNFNFGAVFPKDPFVYEGFQSVRIVATLLLFVMVVRSCIHLFASDGGAHRIAGVDTSVEGGNNIIAMFHQWGAVQLILAALLCLLFFCYPGFTPLIVLTTAFDPVMHLVSSRILNVTSTRKPPGAALNAPAFVVLTLLFLASIVG